MGSKEVKKGLEREVLSETLGHSRQILAWKNEMDEELIQLKEISQEDAQGLEELGLEFSDEYLWRISESQNLPFTFLFDSAFSSTRVELPELYLFDQIAFRDKEQNEGRVFLFSTKKKERLFGLAKFGEKYDGIKQADVESGFFALIVFLKREFNNVE